MLVLVSSQRLQSVQMDIHISGSTLAPSAGRKRGMTCKGKQAACESSQRYNCRTGRSSRFYKEFDTLGDVDVQRWCLMDYRWAASTLRKHEWVRKANPVKTGVKLVR